jgi:hypothetical protein
MLVSISSDKPTPPYDDVTGDDGRFELKGVQPGTYRVEASKGRLQSGIEIVHVPEKEPAPLVQLMLSDLWVLKGKVVADSGPVPAAMIWALPMTAHGTYASTVVPQTRSEIDGSFAVGVPDDAQIARIVTAAPGYALSASSATRQQGASPDDIVIRLAAGGGILEMERVEHRGVVFVNGVPILQVFLTQWAFMNGSRSLPGQSYVVPAMPAGAYVLCDLSDDEATMVLAGVALPTKNVCAEGFLSDGGTLRLFAPEH